jgi:hypothetical protein
MLLDAFDLPLSTQSPRARDAYVEAVERMLCAQPGIEALLEQALAIDPRFALARMALARAQQMHGHGAQARATTAQASIPDAGLERRERSHLAALERVVLGDGAGAMRAIREHLDEWPRDLLVMAPCAGVFGLFGFSGKPGWERELVDFLDGYSGSCGDHWWYLAARAFARCETGSLEAARRDIDLSMDRMPVNANGAHIRAHVDYESDENEAGLAWLDNWLKNYPREGLMHCHLNWHVALWSLELGDTARARQVFADMVAPGAAWGPPLNVLTDSASFLLRDELLGGKRDPVLWSAVADCAKAFFPQPGLAFADAHCAIAHAMTGDSQALDTLRGGAKGPAADMLVELVCAFDAFARGDHRAVLRHLEPLMPVHERIGGSHAQRDLLEYLVEVSRQRAGQVCGPRGSRRRALPAALGRGDAADTDIITGLSAKRTPG